MLLYIDTILQSSNDAIWEEFMKAMTIRGIDPETETQLKKAAHDQGKSINQLVIDMIKKNLGVGKKKFSREYSDLDHLFGKWSEEEFQAVQEQLADTRIIDPELWQK